MKLDSKQIILDKVPFLLRNGLTIGVLGSLACIAAVIINKDQFFFSFLTAGMFWLSILLGALFYTMIHHVVGARWSIVIRRLMESMAAAIPYLGLLLLIGIVVGIHSLYHWSHEEAVAADHLLQHKSAYLNQPFFIVRSVIYVLCWSLLARTLYKKSVAGDQAYDYADNSKSHAVSAPGLILFALTLTFAAFDWMMSLDPHWYSTIFGVYYFAGCAMSFFAFISLLTMMLQSCGYLEGVVTTEHYHDMGKLMFAFMCFWTFIAFSQYVLIWYGNIPEETIWYAHRWEGSWKYVSLFLAIGHFVIPFIMLMPRGSKRTKKILAGFAIWLLFMQFVDMHWLIMPNFHKHDFHLSWIDLVTWIALGGFTLHFIVRKLKKHPLVPIKDPFLKESIGFTNH
jgi:hypothetical protein